MSSHHLPWLGRRSVKVCRLMRDEESYSLHAVAHPLNAVRMSGSVDPASSLEGDLETLKGRFA